jgi:PAS domain S-box-containing protein
MRPLLAEESQGSRVAVGGTAHAWAESGHGDLRGGGVEEQGTRQQGERDSAAQVAARVVEASELRYRRLFESAKDGILILDAATGQIVDANPFLMQLTGYSRDHLLGKHLWQLGLFQDIAASKDAFMALQAQDYVRYDNLPLRASDGRQVEVEFVSNVYDVEGHRVIQCNIRDITARRRAENDLRLRDRAIDAVSQGLVITDPSKPGHPVIYVSPGFTRLTGYTAEDIVGNNCRLLQGVGTDPAAVLVLSNAIAEGRSCTCDLLNYRKDGTPFWNSLSVSPVLDAEGRLTNFVGALTDVTERRTLEAQLLQAQKMEAVGQLAGGIAHDFNNVLSVIVSYADIVCEEAREDGRTCADVEEIRRAALRASDLTRQLLAFSRRQVLQPQVLDLRQTLAGMEKMLRRLLGANIELTLLPSPSLWNVRCDPNQIEQIVMNLAVNARDAMPEGGELTLETANVELDSSYLQTHHDVAAGSYVMLAVTDTGTGIDAETQARIFEPFFTTKERGKGTGLGLATVFGVVKQSGGRILVYSEPGCGTTFKLYFPKVDGVVAAARAAPAEVAPGRGTETILLVEDDDQLRSLACNILRRSGYVVLVAANGGEALLICEKHGAPIHLLLTDVVLPRMNGRQLVERLHGMRPGMRVLFMSGYPDDTVLQHGILESGVAYLQKPLSPASLTRKVREVLSGP